eukprot:11946572-Alexandrium_andersonii.AAC.1
MGATHGGQHPSVLEARLLASPQPPVLWLLPSSALQVGLGHLVAAVPGVLQLALAQQVAHYVRLARRGI